MGFIDDIRGASGRAKIGEVVLDASIEEMHSIEADATEHPVEEGADVSDHYRPRPRVFAIECTVSNTPLPGFPGANIVSGVASLINGDEDPSINAWKILKGYVDNKKVITIETSFETYDSMVLLSVGAPRNVSTANELRFSATAKKLRFVQTEEGFAIKLPPAPKDTTGQKKKPKGKKNNKAADGAKSERTSLAVDALKGIGLF